MPIATKQGQMKSNIFSGEAPSRPNTGKKSSGSRQRGMGSSLIGGIDTEGDRYLTATQIQNSGEKAAIDHHATARKKLINSGDESFGLGMTPMDRLRKELKSRGGNGMLGLMRQFKLADDDGSKSLSQTELSRAIKDYGLDLTDAEIVEMFNQFDEDRSGYIEYEEFARQIMRKKMPQRCKDLVAQAFQKLDKDGSGIIDLDDLAQIYDTSQHPDLISGKKTEEEILSDLLSAFDVGGEVDGKVTLQEFQNYYDYLYIDIPNDDYFELMIRNAWHISGGEGWCANTSNKRVLVTNSDGSESVVEVKNDLGLKEGDKKGLAERLKAQGVNASKIDTSFGSDHANKNNNGKPKKDPPFRGLSKAFTGTSTAKDEYGSPSVAEFSKADAGSLGRPGSSGYQNLTSRVSRSMRSPKKVKICSPAPSVDAHASVNNNHPALAKLKEKLASRGARGIAGLSRAFKRMDKDGNKTLCYDEFSLAMSETGLKLMEPDMRQLFVFFDKDRSGSVSYDEMLTALRGQLNDRRRRLVHMAFKKIDKDGNGYLDVQDVFSAYDASKHPDVIAGKRSSGEVLREFLDTFDVGGEKDGKVTVQEFENYYSNISASIDDDDYFELMIRNAWHISGGKGWCANSSNKRVLVKKADGSEEVVEIEDDLGLKQGDKAGMMSRLRKQGVEAESIELHSGEDTRQKEKDRKQRERDLAKKNSAGAAVQHARKVQQAKRLRKEKQAHEFVELVEDDPRMDESGPLVSAFPGMKIGGMVVKNVQPPTEKDDRMSHKVPRPPPAPKSLSSHDDNEGEGMTLKGSDEDKLKSLKMKGMLHYNRNRLSPAAACYEKALKLTLELSNGNTKCPEYHKILESLNKCRHKLGLGDYGEEEESDEEW